LREGLGEGDMIDLPYSLTIEATEDPDYFGFFLPTWKVSQASGILLKIVFIRQSGA